MSGICYITGAGEHFDDDVFFPASDDLVIAADGGYDFLKAKNIKTDIIIGDFDSCTNITDTNNEKIIRLNPIKDETDMLCAINIGINKGYTIFHIYGGTGNRSDHTIANIQCLAMLSEKGMKGFLFGKNEISTVINNDSIQFDSTSSGYISVFSLTPESKNVSETGLKYEIENYTMKNIFPVGVSNEFIGKNSIISVEQGTLLIIYNKNTAFII